MLSPDLIIAKTFCLFFDRAWNELAENPSREARYISLKFSGCKPLNSIRSKSFLGSSTILESNKFSILKEIGLA